MQNDTTTSTTACEGLTSRQAAWLEELRRGSADTAERRNREFQEALDREDFAAALAQMRANIADLAAMEAHVLARIAAGRP